MVFPLRVTKTVEEEEEEEEEELVASAEGEEGASSFLGWTMWVSKKEKKQRSMGMILKKDEKKEADIGRNRSKRRSRRRGGYSRGRG